MKIMRLTVLALLGVATLVGTGGCRKADPGVYGDGAEILGGGDILSGDYELARRFGANVTQAPDVRFPNVHFAFDSFRIEDSEVYILDQIAEAMRNQRNLVLVIDGHCDVRGSRDYNISLGEHRALAVRSHLIRLGVAGERLQTRSFGAEMPLNPGYTEAAHSQNRRAEFVFFRR